jgi:hypothetical protein
MSVPQNVWLRFWLWKNAGTLNSATLQIIPDMNIKEHEKFPHLF